MRARGVVMAEIALIGIGTGNPDHLTRAAERLFPATPGYRHPPVRPDDADPAP